MTISTEAVTGTKSGTSWTIDVTAANLSEDLTTKDFVVLDNTNELTLNNANITKTSQTLLTYSGSDIGTDIAIEVRRNTPVERYQVIEFASRFNADTYNEEIDRILKRAFEVQLFDSSTDLFIPAPVNQAYGSSWSSDTVKGRTANVLYDQIETMPQLTVDETISGNWTFTGNPIFSGTAAFTGTLDGTTGTVTAATQLTTDDTTKVATTAFVKNLLGSAPTINNPAISTGFLTNTLATTQANFVSNTTVANTAWVTAQKEYGFFYVEPNASPQTLASGADSLDTAFAATASHGNAQYTYNSSGRSYWTAPRTGWWELELSFLYGGGGGSTSRLLLEFIDIDASTRIRRLHDNPTAGNDGAGSSKCTVYVTSGTKVGVDTFLVTTNTSNTIAAQMSARWLGLTGKGGP